MASSPHIWRFFRSGGFDQVRIDTSDDLLALKNLDQKLWVGLSCPVHGMEMDSSTLKLMDLDNDGVIRAPELLATIDWVGNRLIDKKVLTQEFPGVPLKAINDEVEPGKSLVELAHRLAANLNKDDDGILFVEEVAAAQDALIIKEQAQWLAAGDSVRLLGEQTQAAFAAFTVVAAKIEDYFARCQLAGFDERAVTLLDAAPATFTALSGTLLTTANASVADLPLARVGSDSVLPLVSGVNPAWRKAMAGFVTHAVIPLQGEKTELTPADWQAIKQNLIPFGEWMASKPALSKDAKTLADLEKLSRLVRDLMTFANNFVSFRNFYTRQGKAIFQAGTLYLDGRSAELCIKVNDIAKHSALAAKSHLFLVYCDCTRPGAKIKIVAAFTNGSSEHLTVGRNGLFYDRQGRDWDATVVKVVDCPISLRQAFWTPYKKFSRMVGEQFQKFAASKESELEKEMAARTAKPVSVGKQAFDVGKFAGIFAAIGLAVGALGTALAAVFTGLIGLVWWKIPLVILIVIAAISGPSVALTWFRLRSRRLGPLLDANGWAINAHALINIPFGASLTRLAHLPDNAERSLTDPYAQKNSLSKVMVLIALLIVLSGLIWWNAPLLF